MSTAVKRRKAKLTSYETEQIREIAAWKSLPPNAFAELFKRATLPLARGVARVLPDRFLRVAIETAYQSAQMLAGQDDIKLEAGVRDLADLRNKPLEDCDRLANRVGAVAEALATVEGAATGAGGVLTTLIDLPVLFVLSLRTILKIGHCYGYPLEGKREERYVIGVLITATSGTLETRHQRLEQLKQVEELLVEEAREDILTEEALSLLFQLEIFEEVPGLGALSGALLNLALMRRVEHTARRIFQERWLRENGKIRTIAPAAAHALHLAPGWSGAVGRAAYMGIYTLGFGAALPIWAVASMFKSHNGQIAARAIATG